MKFYTFVRYGWVLLLTILSPIFSCLADLPHETTYLTWQKDPSTTMTIQWIGFSEKPNETFFYRHESSYEWIHADFKVNNFPQAPNYKIYSVELDQLNPDSRYSFRFGSSSQESHFHTLPKTLHHPIKFVEGGDMYRDDKGLMIETCQRAANQNPDFALIGGDIAYAIGSAHFSYPNIDRWVEWIKIWHQYMITSEQDLIPVIAAIGNHDVEGHFNQPYFKAAIFSALFPKSQKKTYDVLDFNDYLSVFILDSGHATPIKGEQSDWLKQKLDERKNQTYKIAMYHVPAYPSVRPFDNCHSKSIREHWVPLFEKGGIQIAFEHHDHDYKRTYPLLKNKINPKGIVYIGDGAWGVKKPKKRRMKKIPFYLEKTFKTRYFIVGTIDIKGIKIESISGTGVLLDEYHYAQH